MSKHALIKLKEIFPLAEDLYMSWNDCILKHGPFNGNNNIPALNVTEDKEKYRVTVAAPGLEKKDFNIATDHNIITISASSEQESGEEKEKFTRKEYSYSSFSRSFTLPLHIDSDAITAKYENGILTLLLPKRTEGKDVSEKKIIVK